MVVQHHGATSGAAGTWGTTVPLLLTRPAAASSSQPLGPALLITTAPPLVHHQQALPDLAVPALPESPADENVSASAASFMSTGLDCLALSFKVLSWKSTRNAFQTKLEVEYIWKRE